MGRIEHRTQRRMEIAGALSAEARGQVGLLLGLRERAGSPQRQQLGQVLERIDRRARQWCLGLAAGLAHPSQQGLEAGRLDLAQTARVGGFEHAPGCLNHVVWWLRLRRRSRPQWRAWPPRC